MLTITPVAFAQGSAMSGAPDQMAQGSTLSAGTQAFVKSAADGNHAEVDLATLALGKTSNDQVKQLAQTLKSDHEANATELQSLAAQKHLTLPMETSKAHQATADRLNKLSGADFDKAYVADMVKDHKDDIAEFQKHQHDADPDVSAWVSKTLPTLQNHLKMAEAAQQSIGK